MKRLLAVVVGAFGLRAYLRRRRRNAEPADELRDKLAAQRATTPAEPASSQVAPEPPPAEPVTPPEPAAPGDDVDARRKEVHARARQKIDEISG